MLFIVFDIETIFLYPWAVNYGTLGHSLKVFNLIEMAVFVVILFVGYFYILGKGALDWDESEQAKNADVLSARVVAPRAAIRFGNEKSGPADLSRTPVGPRVPTLARVRRNSTSACPIRRVPPPARDVPRIGASPTGR